MNAKQTCRQVLSVAAVAAGVATLLIGALWPASLTATDEAPAAFGEPPARIAGGGLEIVMTLAPGQTAAAGKAPVLVLHAVNTGKETVEANVAMSMVASSPMSRMSRMAMPSMPVWQETRVIRLEPGQKKDITVETGKPLPAGNEVRVRIAAVQARRFAADGATFEDFAFNPNAASLLLTSGVPAIQTQTSNGTQSLTNRQVNELLRAVAEAKAKSEPNKP